MSSEKNMMTSVADAPRTAIQGSATSQSRGEEAALPCPFCGNAPEVGTHGETDETGESYGYSYCECNKCSKPFGSRGPSRFIGVHADTESEAVHGWNARVNVSASEPVGYRWRWCNNDIWTHGKKKPSGYPETGFTCEPLYAAPVSRVSDGCREAGETEGLDPSGQQRGGDSQTPSLPETTGSEAKADLIARIIESHPAFNCAPGWTFTQAAREIAYSIVDASPLPTGTDYAGLVERLQYSDENLQRCVAYWDADGITENEVLIAARNQADAAQALLTLQQERDAAEWCASQWRCAGAVVSQYGECTPVDLAKWTPVEMSQAIHRIGERLTASQAECERLKGEVERLTKAEDILRRLVSAKDVWTDYGSGFRIHFSFAPSTDMQIVTDVISARTALSSKAGDGE